MRVRIEQLEVHRDHRGYVYEPLDLEGLARQQNVHVVSTRPGGVRGNHYHRRGTELLTIVGPALVRFREEQEVQDLDIPAGEVFRFTIPPGVAHAIQNNGDQPNLIVAFNSEFHDRDRPDVVRAVVIQE